MGGRLSLSGVAWDHKRCWGPLEASARPYGEKFDVDVHWDRRSLFSFGEGDLAEMCRRFDLVIFDHPYAGEVAAQQYMLDLNAFLTAADLAHFQADSVGRSWESYFSNGGVWALPIDAAAQTAAWRPDLMERFGFDVPVTLDDVYSLAGRARDAGVWVAWPAKPTDLMCTLLSLAASMGQPVGGSNDGLLHPAAATEAIGILRRLAGSVHPSSRVWNPIEFLDAMAGSDELIYAPYTFNYVNYATNAERPIRFGAPPEIMPNEPARGLLGGAGIGISANCAAPEAAFAYARHLCSAEVQSTDYVREGGQPASRAAWTSPDCDQIVNGFFGDTLPALDTATLRPTPDGFVPFFHEATHRLAGVVYDDKAVEPFLSWINAAFDQLPQTAPQTAGVGS